MSHHQPCHGLPNQYLHHAHHLHHLPGGGRQEEQTVTSQPGSNVAEDRRMMRKEEVEYKDGENREVEGEVCPAYSKIILEHTVRLLCISLLG